MSAIYIHAGAVAGGVNELKSVLLQLMHPMKSNAELKLQQLNLFLCLFLIAKAARGL